MGPPWKFQFLQDVVRQERPTIVFLCETLSNKERMEWVRTRLGFQGMIVVEANGRSGGLSLLWKETNQVELLSLSKYHIDVVVNVAGLQSWRLTSFYGEPNRNMRRKTWDLLKNLARDSNLPWCVMGDWNNIIAQTDKKGGAPYPQWLLDGFNEVLAEIGLNDLKLYGHQYTWEKGRGTEAWLEIRLDRAMATGDWFELFPLARLYNLEGTPSDHSPIFMMPTNRSSMGGKKRFRFENAWLTEPCVNTLSVIHGRQKGMVPYCRRSQNQEGAWVDWQNGLQNHITQFYTDLFTAAHTNHVEVIDAVSQSISQTHNRELLQEVTKDESFFCSGEILQGLNETNIILIPKKKNPTKVSDLRPIVLCNVLMKVITKVLANRMKDMLEKVVSESQSAFIPGRLISDNIMVSYEIMHYLKKKKIGKDGYMALKLDMSKAYDRVEWEFLKAIMRKMGFSDWRVHLVLKCVTAVSYSIVHGLSSLIRKYEAKQWIRGIKICRKAPTISHMFFADDSYFYCKAGTKEARKVLELLEVYEHASGQKVNKAKSSIFFSTNVIQYNKEEICFLMQMPEANEHSMYLGLPNLLGRNKSALLGYLKERVNAKIKTWDGKFISRGGKEILVKSIVQALPSYAMNVFLLPLEITRDIEKSISKFWWNSSQSSASKINWMSWERMAKYKTAGGMGFRNFRDFNIAMLGKQGWRFITNPSSLVSRLYKEKYFADTEFIHAKVGNNPSFIWRSIVEAKQLLIAGIRWRIGRGDNIQVLDQPWLMEEDNPFVTTSSQSLEDKTVKDFLIAGKNQWDVNLVREHFNERDQGCILNISLNSSSSEDMIYWRFEESGLYSVKSAHKHLQVQKRQWTIEDNSSIWKKLWRIKAPPKALNLIWRALSQCLPTMSQLQAKHVPVQSNCPVCKSATETIMHSLVNCPIARQYWLIVLPGKQWDAHMEFMRWIKMVFDSENNSKCAQVFMVCWTIWRARNDLVWNHKYTRVGRIVAEAKQHLTQWNIAQSRLSQASLQPAVEGDGASVWARPLPNIVKVSVDVVVFEDRDAVGFGLIARGSDGRLITAKSIVHPHLVSPVTAEAMAIKEALSWIDVMQWPHITVESDCLVVIQAIRSNTPMRSYFGVIIEECRSLLKRFHKVSLFFVKRSANMVAHQLARESYNYPGCSFDRRSVPVNVQNCIEMDLK
ncbi:hypothetical protein AgCh_004207 [Apium graveolens]